MSEVAEVGEDGQVWRHRAASELRPGDWIDYPDHCGPWFGDGHRVETVTVGIARPTVTVGLIHREKGARELGYWTYRATDRVWIAETMRRGGA